MKKIYYLAGLLLFLAGYATNIFAQVSNENEDGVYKVEQYAAKDYVHGQVLVKFKDANRIQIRRAAGRVSSTSSNPLTELLQKYGEVDMEQLLPDENPQRAMRRSKAYNGETVQEHDLSQLYLLNMKECSNQETMQMVNDLQALDEVEFAEPNYKMYIMADDNIAADYSANPMVSQQWYLDAYGVKELWNKPIVNKTRPVIAIIDTGVDITHPDLKDNIWTNQVEVDGRDDYDNDRNGFKNDIHGWDFINNTPRMRDNNKHGTHVAGIAAAANNGNGIVGANPKALIMPITVMQSDGTGDVATIVKGINYAVKNGATVLNLSLGTYANSNSLRQALSNAYQNAVIVAAAGNDHRCIYKSHAKKHNDAPPMPSFPAAYSFVLGVQATTASGGYASFSNYDDDGPLASCEATANDPDGFNYELKAPGTNIISSIPGGRYEILQGTSMAAPLVAGAISALQMVKEYDNQEILWGDLLHSNNISEAYNVKDRPAELDVMRIVLRDRNEQTQYDEDKDEIVRYYDVTVGETLMIFPVIRSSFGKATNIKLKISAPTGIEIITDEVDFGFSLDAFGNMTSKNPLVIKIPEEMPNASTLVVTVLATCDESDDTSSAPFELRVCNMYTLKGLIMEDMTLTPEHVYYVSSSVCVDEGTTLTIKPGTRLEFAKDAYLYGLGKLNIKGTPEKPIVFTAYDTEERWAGIYSHNNRDLQNYYNPTLYTNIDSTLFTMRPTEITPNEFHAEWTYCYYDTEDNKPQNLSLLDYMDNWINDMTGKEGLLTDPNYLTPAMTSMLAVWKTYSKQYSVDKPNRAYVHISIPSWKIYNDPTDTLYYCRLDGIGEPTSYSHVYNPYRRDPFYSDCMLTCYMNKYSKTVGTTIYPKSTEYGNSVKADNDFICVPSESLKNAGLDAHGFVLKVTVNDVDPEYEQDQLIPLGIGKHKFEVFFNRPMNKTVDPTISFGVISPYNKHTVAEDVRWNENGTIYTAYKTITGTAKSDGQNRIYVRGAEDNEFFPCPVEVTRYNFMLQAAGSMASGFQADAGLGCVKLTWNNENNDFEDAMGFNVYRYNPDVKKTIPGHYDENWKWIAEKEVIDTVRINEDILDITATSYIDDNVTPGQTYYYLYKVLSTDLQEYDVSNVVAATPLTATRGDANGSGSVDVADVVTTVNYVTGLQPKPFVFDAADMNSDKLIDIFDVVGIIRGILNPSLLASAQAEGSAVYFIEDGTLYVESPVTLGGVQVQLTLDGRDKMEDVSVASDLDGFETASAWLSDNDYLFLAYSMNGKTLAPGKHALLHIGDADITSLRLSDTSGKNVNANQGGTTGIDRMGKHVMNVEGVYDLQGRKLSTQDFELSTLKKGIYIINGKKVVK